MISGLKVASDMKGVRQNWLDLPATYTREELPADVEEVATRDKVAGWEHLKELVDKVCRKSDIEIGLLIGATCAKASEPQGVFRTFDKKYKEINNMQSSTCEGCSFWKYCTPLFWYPR